MFTAPRDPDLTYDRPQTVASAALTIARGQRWLMVAGALAGIAWMILQAVLPWAFGRGMDAFIAFTQGDEPSSAVLFWVGVIIANTLGIALAGLLRHSLAVTNWLRAALPIMRNVGHHISRIGATLPHRMPTGDVMNVVSSDAPRIGQMFDLVCRGTGAFVSLAFVTIVALSTSLKMGLVVLLGVPIVVAAMAAFTKAIHTKMMTQRAKAGELVALGADGVAGLRVLRGVGGETHFEQRYVQQSQDVRRVGNTLATLNGGLSGVQHLMPGLLTAALLYVGVGELRAGAITAGQLVSFFGYALFLMIPFETVSEVFRVVARGMVGLRKYINLMGLPTRQEAVPHTPTRDDDVPVGVFVDQVSGATIEPGALTTVVCERPSVSADVIHRIARLAPGNEESATVDGTPLAQWPLAAVRRRIALSDSEPQLLAGTLRSQLDPERRHTDDECLTGLTVACGEDILDLLPLGLRDYVTEKGRSLSGGQRQRIALARAVVRDADVLALVEPTSAVDAHTEMAIASRLHDHRQGRTTIVASTSPLLGEVSDRVVFLTRRGDGTISATTGTHAELVSTSSAYRRVVLRTVSTDDVSPCGSTA